MADDRIFPKNKKMAMIINGFIPFSDYVLRQNLAISCYYGISDYIFRFYEKTRQKK